MRLVHKMQELNCRNKNIDQEKEAVISSYTGNSLCRGNIVDNSRIKEYEVSRNEHV